MNKKEKPPSIGGGTGYTKISQYDSDFLNFVLPVPRGLNSQLLLTVTVLIPVLRKAGLPTDRSDALAPSGYQPLLANYGDEFVPDFHRFPFSPDIFLSDTLRIFIQLCCISCLF